MAKVNNKYRSIPHLIGSKQLDTNDVSMDQLLSDYYTRLGKDGWLVIVELKYDGTNVGIKRKGNEIITFQRHGFTCDSSKWQFHKDFDVWVQSRKAWFLNELKEGVVLNGEWLGTTHTIDYKTSKRQAPFVFFDVKANGVRCSEFVRQDWKRAMKEIGVRENKVIHRGSAISPYQITNNMIKWAEPIKIKEGQNHEGFVYRIIKDNGDFVSIAKWVRPDFSPNSKP